MGEYMERMKHLRQYKAAHTDIDEEITEDNMKQK